MSDDDKPKGRHDRRKRQKPNDLEWLRSAKTENMTEAEGEEINKLYRSISQLLHELKPLNSIALPALANVMIAILMTKYSCDRHGAVLILKRLVNDFGKSEIN